GPPGTGKTEFVKYLGSVLKTKVNVRMGSDLLSMWVGGTEQNIASAFREAEAERAILFLDEIDGLVQSRAGAQRSWEVTQVNELLQQMENFNGVMIGATNFVQNLDQAIMRRFTFKLQFDYLNDVGKQLFFERMFKTVLSDEERQHLNMIPNLAPGDFRTVRQSLFYYGGEVSNAQRLDALEREAETKNCGRFVAKRKIGF
ncbi:MAG: AAA family ATPase, partial [Lentisphaerae bacterium]|nr:AAA family ATPase [Lentisphaerota bacterium]